METSQIAKDMRKKQFAREFVKNGGNATYAYAEISPHTTYGNQKSRASEMLKKPDVKAEIERLTDGIGLNKDFIRSEYLKNYKNEDDKCSKGQQLHCLDKMGDIVGSFQKNDQTELKQLNVLNIVNFLQTEGAVLERKTLQSQDTGDNTYQPFEDLSSNEQE